VVYREIPAEEMGFLFDRSYDRGLVEGVAVYPVMGQLVIGAAMFSRNR
jgi:hypothetical protein